MPADSEIPLMRRDSLQETSEEIIKETQIFKTRKTHFTPVRTADVSPEALLADGSFFLWRGYRNWNLFGAELAEPLW